MRTWTVQDAKARFKELLKTRLAEGQQMVSRHWGEVGMLAPIEKWRRPKTAVQPSLKQLLLATEARMEPFVTARVRRVVANSRLVGSS